MMALGSSPVSRVSLGGWGRAATGGLGGRGSTASSDFGRVRAGSTGSEARTPLFDVLGCDAVPMGVEAGRGVGLLPGAGPGPEPPSVLGVAAGAAAIGGTADSAPPAV